MYCSNNACTKTGRRAVRVVVSHASFGGEKDFKMVNISISNTFCNVLGFVIFRVRFFYSYMRQTLFTVILTIWKLSCVRFMIKQTIDMNMAQANY